MDEKYDVIQAPKNLRREDLPAEIQPEVPFEANGIRYILTKCFTKDFEVCEIDGETTGVPESISEFYSIKRL